MTLREPGAEPESIVSQRVTAGFFDVLRVRPALGYAFAAENEVSGRERVAVLSDALWRRRFGGDRAIVGRTSPLEEVESGERGYEVIGVMPPDFAYPVGVARATEVWVPYVVPANQRIRDPHHQSYYLQVTAQLSPRVERTAQLRDWAPALAEVVDRISRISGVTHASLISGGIPLGGSMSATSIAVPGRTLDKSSDDGISIRTITPDYHKALGIPLRSGRLFEPTDRKGAANVVIINESAARKYFPGENPVGRVATINNEQRTIERTIVGVVGDVHQTSLETEPRTEAYVPLEQGRVLGGELVVRTSGRPYDVLPAMKVAVASVLPDVPLRNVRTMEELIASRMAQRRFNMLLLGLFGVLGLVIAAVGIYGVMAYVVSQRTHEIGVRMALGATRSNVIGMVLLKARAPVAAGLVIGGAGAWYLSAAAKAFLFRLEPTDPRAFAAALLLLSAAALVASAIPARRAARVDPMIALRAE